MGTNALSETVDEKEVIELNPDISFVVEEPSLQTNKKSNRKTFTKRIKKSLSFRSNHSSKEEGATNIRNPTIKRSKSYIKKWVEERINSKHSNPSKYCKDWMRRKCSPERHNTYIEYRKNLVFRSFYSL